MLKKNLLTILFLSSVCIACAQTESTTNKNVNHFLGVQANPLFRQLINLSNNNSNLITNPYLVTYAFAFSNSGWGVHTGVGYNYQVVGDKDAPADRQSRINEFSYRVGFGRKVALSKKFEAEFSLDLAGDYENNRTFSLSVTDFGSGFSDSVSTTVLSKTKSIGGGLRGGLSFYVSPRVVLGTEANYYFMHSPQRQNINVKQTFTQVGAPPVTKSTNENQLIDNSKFSLTLPAVLFLIVKF